MIKAVTHLFLCLWVTQGAFAQTAFPKDTSFTLHATLEKELKYRPYIKIAAAELRGPIQETYNITYKQLGQRNLQLDIFSPQDMGSSALPAVLLIHGGGWMSGEKSQMHTIAKQLASQGYVCFSAAYRLTPEAAYPAAVLDLKDAIAWIRSHASTYNVQENQIAVLGTSAGGQLASLLGTAANKEYFGGQYSGKAERSAIQAVINIDGVLAFHHPESKEGSSASAWLSGDYTQKPENWEEASALTHVSAASAPTIFLNSSNLRFHAGRDDMVEKYEALGIYSEIHEFGDSPHPFWFFDPWYSPMMQKIDLFLERVFKHSNSENSRNQNKGLN